MTTQVTVLPAESVATASVLEDAVTVTVSPPETVLVTTPSDPLETVVVTVRVPGPTTVPGVSAINVVTGEEVRPDAPSVIWRDSRVGSPEIPVNFDTDTDIWIKLA